jgi:hypothetical protein
VILAQDLEDLPAADAMQGIPIAEHEPPDLLNGTCQGDRRQQDLDRVRFQDLSGKSKDLKKDVG